MRDEDVEIGVYAEERGGAAADDVVEIRGGAERRIGPGIDVRAGESEDAVRAHHPGAWSDAEVLICRGQNAEAIGDGIEVRVLHGAHRPHGIHDGSAGKRIKAIEPPGLRDAVESSVLRTVINVGDGVTGGQSAKERGVSDAAGTGGVELEQPRGGEAISDDGMGTGGGRQQKRGGDDRGRNMCFHVPLQHQFAPDGCINFTKSGFSLPPPHYAAMAVMRQRQPCSL